MKEYPHTPTIAAILGESWKASEDNPNMLLNRSMEALYVYADCVKYWEDTRAPNGYMLFDIDNFEKQWSAFRQAQQSKRRAKSSESLH